MCSGLEFCAHLWHCLRVSWVFYAGGFSFPLSSPYPNSCLSDGVGGTTGCSESLFTWRPANKGRAVLWLVEGSHPQTPNMLAIITVLGLSLYWTAWEVLVIVALLTSSSRQLRTLRRPPFCETQLCEV